MLNNFLWWFCYSKVRLTVRKSLRLLCWLNESVLHLVDFLPLAECHHHRLCGAAVHHAWGEGMLNDFQSVTVYLRFDFYTTAVYCVNVFCFKPPSLLILFAFPPQEPFKKKKKMFVSSQVPLPKEAIPSTPPLSLQISWSQASPLSFQLQLLQIDEFLVSWVHVFS